MEHAESDLRAYRVLGRTGLEVSRIGLAGGYKIPARAVEKAVAEYGINYFYWETRKPGMGQALRSLSARDRQSLVIAIQTYDHLGFWAKGSVEKALSALAIERADILLLGWFNRMPSRRILDATARLKDEGKIGFVGVTGHNRKFHGMLAHKSDSLIDVLQIRYSAAHRGAEDEVFRGLLKDRPGITTYTATRWGKLLKASKMPPGEKPLTAADCYRFVLSHPAVDVCIAGPRTEQEMDEGLVALDQGPLNEDEMARARRIGDHVHG
jgi:aryl-alcohol dehydrogenase-like predicted oxidoreductase